MDQDKILSIFRTTGALLDGHFVLTSGRHSPTYFQCAKVLQYPKYLTVFSRMIAEKFEKYKPDVVISPAIGGIVLGTEVSNQIGCRSIFAERKEGRMVIRRGFSIDKEERIMIVEDVITTGGSVKEVMNLVSNIGAKIVGIGILVDRSNGKVKLHNNQYSIVKLDAVSYRNDDIPDELDVIPIQKPGSRYIS